MKSYLAATSAITLFLCSGALAEDKRAADAHQHGHGVLNVALEGETLGIELETPGADILGFEHAAEADEDKATVEQARKTLSDPVALFGLPGSAGCKVTEAEIEIGADETDHDDHDDDHHEEHADGDHDDHDDDHHEEHADEDHDDHDDDHHEEHADDDHDDEHDKHADDEKHGHDDHAEEEASHSEVHAHYTLTCDAPAKITGLDLTNFFATFPNAEELDSAILTDNGQASGEITAEAPKLTF